MMKLSLTMILLFLMGIGFSQQIPQKYFVAFRDKNGTPYTISDPQAFLTQRAIDRRNAQGIPIIEEDLPVNPTYVNKVAATGVQVYTRCKWFNGITVRATDSSVLNSIRALPFVQSVTRVTSYNSKKSDGAYRKFKVEKDLFRKSEPHKNLIPGTVQAYNYGPSYAQIHLLNGDVLHNEGYRGQGKVIAVLDDGFMNVDINPEFDSLRANNQILGTRDFVEPDSDVYRQDSHGEGVLSTMACDDPGNLIGTAPKASYWLIRTEDVNSENIVEEYNWVVGAEMADSVGADIISSSLGYSSFDNDWMDHTCADMNGYTNPSTRGANTAESKGMAISISAGNSGGYSTCVDSPSDAVAALAIGAVDSLGHYAFFSSTGTYVKPNLASMGVDCTVASPDTSYGFASGTSFSCPINAGLMACLWQARPTLTPSQLYLAIEKSSSQYAHPDSILGYGIPDYAKALVYAGAGIMSKTTYKAYPNPFKDGFTVSFDSNVSGSLDVTLITLTGQTILNTRENIASGGTNTFRINGLADLLPGMYLLRVTSEGTSQNFRLIKIEE
ncbi:MAG: S8/S53 family peptidase [Bacteroidales bacterium]